MSKCLSVTFGSLLCRTTSNHHQNSIQIGNPGGSSTSGLDSGFLAQEASFVNNNNNVNNILGSQGCLDSPGLAGIQQCSEEPLDLRVPCPSYDDGSTAVISSEGCLPMLLHQGHSDGIGQQQSTTGKKRALSPLSPRTNSKGSNNGANQKRSINNDAKALRQDVLETAAAIAWNRFPQVASDYTTTTAATCGAAQDGSDESNEELANLDSEIIHKTTSLVSNEYFALVTGAAANNQNKNSKPDDMSGNSATSSGDKRQFRLSEWERTNFRCSICGKMFKHLTNVSRHKRMIHNASFDSPPVCAEATENSSTSKTDEPGVVPSENEPNTSQTLAISDQTTPEIKLPESSEHDIVITKPKIVEKAMEKEMPPMEISHKIENHFTSSEKVEQRPEILTNNGNEMRKSVIEQNVHNNNQANSANSMLMDTQMTNLANILCSTSAPNAVNLAGMGENQLKQGLSPSPGLLESFHAENLGNLQSFTAEQMTNFEQQNSTKALLNLLMDINKTTINSALSLQAQQLCTAPTNDVNQMATSPQSLGNFSPESSASKNSKAAQRRLKKPVPKNTFQYSKVRLPFPIEISPEERSSLACNVCKYQFTILSNLRRHKKVYGHYEKHICPKCKEIFTSKDRFNTHTAKCDGSVKPQSSMQNEHDSNSMQSSEEMTMKSEFDATHIDEDGFSDELDDEQSYDGMDCATPTADCAIPSGDSASCSATSESYVTANLSSTDCVISSVKKETISQSSKISPTGSLAENIPQSSQITGQQKLQQQNLQVLNCQN
ncbi:uncharacterized protein LOC142351059 isoform X2 [Convolutriloba macropyga]